MSPLLPVYHWVIITGIVFTLLLYMLAFSGCVGYAGAELAINNLRKGLLQQARDIQHASMSIYTNIDVQRESSQQSPPAYTAVEIIPSITALEATTTHDTSV